MSELKRCPFCGGEAKITEWDDSCDYDKEEAYHVECDCCEGNWYETKQQAIDAWNKRHNKDGKCYRLCEECEKEFEKEIVEDTVKQVIKIINDTIDDSIKEEYQYWDVEWVILERIKKAFPEVKDE